MLEYFAEKVVLTDEEFEAYMRVQSDEYPTITESSDFEICGERYRAVALQFPDDRPPYDWYTRIFVVKEK